MNNQIPITQLLRIAVLFLLVGSCFLIVRPFLIVILWAIILAMALFPLYNKWIHKIGVSKKSETLLFTTIFLSPFY